MVLYTIASLSNATRSQEHLQIGIMMGIVQGLLFFAMKVRGPLPCGLLP